MAICIQALLMICMLAGINAAPAQDDKKCGGIFYDEFGEIQSPNYPKRWKEDSIDCVWTIQAAKGKNVRITFLDFSLEDFFGECSLEKLSVHDGAHITSPALGKLLCGDSNPPTITSNDNALTLYLTSQDGANYGSGFKLQWNIVPDDEPNDCSMNTCGGRVVNKPGCSVQSPSYPHKYDANLTCTWVLETSADEPITVDFLDMMMYEPETGDENCPINYVTVYDGTTTASKVILEKSCQKEEDEEMKVVSSGKTMLIVLTTGPKNSNGEGASDFEHHYRGFSLKVSMPGIPTEEINPEKPVTTIPPRPAPNHEEGNKASPEPVVTSQPPPSPATVSGVVIGTIVGLVVLVLGVLVFVAFVHWRRQNHRWNIRLRNSDSSSDSNTLISSGEFEEEPDLKTQKKNGKIVRVTENDLRQAGVYEL